MPYRSNADLPPAVRKHLPQEAQTIYRETFNSAWERYRPIDPRCEEIAHRMALAAVKRRYHKQGGLWTRDGAAAVGER